MSSQLFLCGCIINELFNCISLFLFWYFIFRLYTHTFSHFLNSIFLLNLLFNFECQQSFSNLITIIARWIDQSRLSHKSKCSELGLVIDYIIKSEIRFLDEGMTSWNRDISNTNSYVMSTTHWYLIFFDQIKNMYDFGSITWYTF